MPKTSVIPIIVHLQEISNSGLLGSKIMSVLQKNSKNSQFMITVPERQPRPVRTGSQDFDDEEI